jgi:nitrite reductase/ring-hydroxylating ferredoxin subunit
MFKQKTNSAAKDNSEAESLHSGGLSSILKNDTDNQDSFESISNVISESKMQKSSSKSMLLVQEIQKLDAQTIKPLIDYTNGGIIYPILSKIGESENDIPFLDNLTSDGILSKIICEKLIVCPKHPHVFSSNMRLYCPKCNSINIEKLNLFEHKQCGYISESKNFDFSNIDNSSCPSCKKHIKDFDKEIRIPAMWYQCIDCVEKFDNAVIKLHCKKDDHDFDINSGKFVSTFCYKLKNSDVSNVSDTAQIKHELIKFLCERKKR